MEGREEERKLRSKGRDTRRQKSVERREDHGREEKIGRMRKKDRQAESTPKRQRDILEDREGESETETNGKKWMTRRKGEKERRKRHRQTNKEIAWNGKTINTTNMM